MTRVLGPVASGTTSITSAPRDPAAVRTDLRQLVDILLNGATGSTLVALGSLRDNGAYKVGEFLGDSAWQGVKVIATWGASATLTMALQSKNVQELLQDARDLMRWSDDGGPTKITPKVGETASTATGKSIHKVLADARRASGEFELVSSPITDQSGRPILMSKRVNLKTGIPQP